MQEHPKRHVQSKYRSKGVCTSVWWNAKAFRISQKLILYQWTNIVLKLAHESPTWPWRPTFPSDFPIMFATPLPRDETRLLGSHEATPKCESLFWFLYTDPLCVWIPNLLLITLAANYRELEATYRLRATIIMLWHLSSTVSLCILNIIKLRSTFNHTKIVSREVENQADVVKSL